MSRILLIGGTGFIGRSLLSSLSSEHTITVVARSLDDKSGILSAQPNITFFSGFDICHPQTFSDFFARHDIVINLAGLVSFHQKDREKLMNINYQGTLNIIAACEKNKIQKLIHVSSTAAL